jgi:hypothetical protein
MKMIQMSAKNYDCLLRNVPEASYLGPLLQESFIAAAADGSKVFFRLWRDADLKLLRDLAAEKCPGALLEIDKE